MTSVKESGEFDLGQRQTLLVMKAFLCSETLFFAALIIAYVYFRNFSQDWGTSSSALEWKAAGFFTACLVLSSLTLNLAVRSYEKSKQAQFLFWALSTLALGAAFLGHQMGEYSDLIRQTITWDASLFGSAFYTLTGFHTLHVFLGMVMLTISFGLMAKQKLRRPSSGARSIEYYWHFVDVVWLFVFYFVYITPLL